MGHASLILIVVLSAWASGATWDQTVTTPGMTSLLPKIDHLVYATPDSAATVDRLERLLGVRATPGGQHPGRGTRNFLVSLGTTTYLEIIGPDPDQPAPSSPRAFGIDGLSEARLVTWAAHDSDLPRVVREAAVRGVTLGTLGDGSRKRPDGVLLKWRYTSPLTVVADGIAPFFIDWGESEHPARTAAKGAALVSLRAEHPDAGRVQEILKNLGLDLAVTKGPRALLVAAIDSPRGRVELR